MSADGHGYEPCGVGYVEGGHEYAFGPGDCADAVDACEDPEEE